MGEVTKIISAIRSGDENGNGTEQLFAVVYDQLRLMARKKLQSEKANSTWRPTALVNEAYLKLVRADEIEWQDRLHFFRAAAQAMRRILIDKARHKKRFKHGGGFNKNAFSEYAQVEGSSVSRSVPDDHQRLLDLDDALVELEKVAAERAELVRLHFFAGLSQAQCADLLGVSLSTVERQWRCTKAWLRQHMG